MNEKLRDGKIKLMWATIELIAGKGFITFDVFKKAMSLFDIDDCKKVKELPSFDDGDLE